MATEQILSESLSSDAKPASDYVITRYRDRTSNLRTQLTRIIERAGLTAWPKLWHNLRATRETELAEKFPMHVVCEWIGHSQAVAAKHYLQTTNEHFELAATPPTGALQKALHTAADTERIEAQQESTDDDNSPDCASLRQCTSVPMSPAGLEPTTYGLKGAAGETPKLLA